MPQDEQEAPQGAHSLHGPPAEFSREQLREAKVPECAGPHGAGGEAQPHRHPGQDLVPEQKVRINSLFHLSMRWSLCSEVCPQKLVLVL